ncbi:pirin family protein [Motiliproteus sediminis]|uniref:pirin family protein n=1 Tax=Motiliproteus sediminis TaxID=1468178 RepID=UPI001AEF7F5B|nr:pirin family protein [Motiliproteus sediminis]
MSNLIEDSTPDCCTEQPCAAVERIIKPRTKDLDGFSVRRVLPTQQQRMVGPWVFFDHLGPVEFKAGSGIDVRPHPHINLATVTYLFEGEILHRDSLGSEVAIRPGDINLMVAGRGITHSERESISVRNHRHRLHALQLWLALPEADEECEPAFHHYPKADIPVLDQGGVPVRVMMGSAYGVTSPVRTFADTLYLEARLTAGQGLQLPPAEARALYLVSGSVRVDGQRIDRHDMAVLAVGAEVRLQAEADSRVVLIGGDQLPPRQMFWNFVSSRAERIEAAKADWQEGRFAAVVGDEQEYIPLPE